MNDFFEQFLNILVGGLLIVYVVFITCRKLKLKGSRPLFLILFTLEHFVITFIFAFFLEKFVSVNDPQRFYKIALESDSWISLVGFGNKSISFIIYPLVKSGLQIETLFILFSTIGWTGFLFLFEDLNLLNQKKINFIQLFFLMPSINLWTSSLSKEPLLIFLFALIIKNMNSRNIINTISIISISLILFIRPHVFFVLIGVISCMYLFNSDLLTRKKRVIYSTLFFLTIVIALYLVLMYFLNLDSFDYNYLKSRYIQFVNSYSNSGNAGINLVSTSFIERVLLMMFMPLPLLYDSNNFFQHYISIENIYYVLAFGYIFILLLKNRKKIEWKNEMLFTFYSSILLIILFGSYIYNFGLANRMRIMFYPMLFYFILNLRKQKVV